MGESLLDLQEKSKQNMIQQENIMSRPVFHIVPNSPDSVEKIPIIIKFDMQYGPQGEAGTQMRH